MTLPTRRVITDPTPRVAVRWDDGSHSQVPDILTAIELGIPVSLAINWGSIRTSGSTDPTQSANIKMTLGQLLGLKRKAAAAGVPFCLVNHTRTNWGQKSVTAYTVDDFIYELDNDPIEAATGLRPVTYLQPGDGALDYIQRHHQMVRDILVDLGYQFAQGLLSVVGDNSGGDGAGFTQNSILNAYPGSDKGAAGGSIQSIEGVRPGQVMDPFSFSGGYTVDLGSRVVTRGVAGDPDSVDPLSGEPAWLLGEDNGRGAVDGSRTADWDRTWTHFYSRAIGAGLSFQVGLHGERRSNETAFTLTDGSGSVARPRHWSARHVLMTLRALEDAGFIKLVTVDEWCGYLYGDYAPGIDLINNPTTAIPHRVIGDMAAGDYPCPAGMTRRLVGVNTFPGAYSVWASMPADADGDQYYNQPVNLDQIIGPAVVGVRGREGGVRLRPDDDSNVSYTGLSLGWFNLPPGFYRFVADVEVDGGSIRPGIMAAVGARWLDDPDALLASEDVRQACSRLQYAPVFGRFDSIGTAVTAGAPNTLEIPFRLPSNPRPALCAVSTQTPGTIANGGTFQFFQALTGVTAEHRLRVVAEEPLAGCSVSAAVVQPNLTQVTITNNTGSNATPTPGEFYVIAEELEGENGYPTLESFGATGRWIYSVQLDISKDGLNEAVMSNFRLLYWPEH